MTPNADPLAALTGQEHAVSRLNAIAHDPPQSIVIEGGDADSRVALALYWAMRLNCASGDIPCGQCPACKQIADFAFNDLLFFDGREGLIKVQPSGTCEEPGDSPLMATASGSPSFPKPRCS